MIQLRKLKNNPWPGWLYLLFLLACSMHSVAQYKPKLLRFDEEYSGVTDSMKKKHALLNIKNVPIGTNGTVRASFGLDYREMYELSKGFDSVATSDGYWVTRLMVHANILFGEKFRLFVQPGRGVITGRKLPPRAVDEDQLFLLNAFAEYRFGNDRQSFVRVGRQELFFGMGRFIAPREGPNIRNTYDGARIRYTRGNASSDIFFTYLVNNRPGVFDNEVLSNNQRCWGAYHNWRGNRINIDVFYLGFYNPSAFYSKQPTRAKETRHTAGLRVFGNVNRILNIDAEAGYQFGRFGDYTIDAFLGDAKLSAAYKLGKSAFKSSAKFTFSTGNRSVPGKELNTFNPLFPNLLYYQTAIGIFPANIVNTQVLQEWNYGKFTAAAGVDFFWRQASTDGLYAPFGYLDPGAGTDKYLGYQLYNKLDLEITPQVVFSFLASRYYKSNFIKANPNARGVDLLLALLMNVKL